MVQSVIPIGAVLFIVAEVGYMVGGAWLGNRDGLTGAVLHILNDGLMTLFFFVIGLEVKREIVTGENLEDAQAGFESLLTALPAALAGANLIYGLGMIEMGMTIDYGQMVMDNEFARMIKYVVQGIPVNDETLALDVVEELGPTGRYLAWVEQIDPTWIH